MPVVFLRWRDSGTSWWSTPQVVECGPNLFEARNAFTLRRSRLRRLGRFVGWIDGWQVRRALRRVGFIDLIVWLSVPDPTLLWGMPTNRLVYDCVDPCFLPGQQHAFDVAEAAAVRQAQLVFCTAHTLYQKLLSIHRNCQLLPNACSEDTFDASQGAVIDRPETLAAIKGPVVGYMGTIDWRFDAAIVEHAAKFLPNYTFVLVGRVNADQETRVEGLRSLGNVIFTGSVSHGDGLRFTAAFDVGLIPFEPGEMNDAINPVKMYMYLVAGKPVVSTWVNECVLLPDLVMAARSLEEFAALVQTAVETDDAAKRAARVKFGLANRWADRARTALEMMNSAGLFA